MATTARVIPNTRYYSGQGRVMMGDRDPTTGVGSNFIQVGNVPDLSIDIANTKFTHRESMTGGRNQDLINFKEKTATAKFTFESLTGNNLAMGLYGPLTTITTATPVAVAAEPHKYSAASGIVPLRRPNVATVVVTKTVGSTVINASQYNVDTQFGTIYFVPNPTGLVDGDPITVSYAAGGSDHVDGLTTATLIEKYFRFEGLNTLNGDAVLVQIPRFAIDPTSTLALINDEIGTLPMTGNVLQDTFITGTSQFFTVDYIAAGS